MLRPGNWSRLAFTVLSCELGAFGLVMWLVGVVAPWFDRARSHALLWLGCWFVGMVMMGAALFCSAWASHRRELRADALAAELLGDAGPVLAMLDGCQARHERLGRTARLACLLTHPFPTRRSRQLRGAGTGRRSPSAPR